MSVSSNLPADPFALSQLSGDENRDLAVACSNFHEAPSAARQIVEAIGKIVDLSQRLFPGPVSFAYSFDPENPSDEWLVFDVVAQGEYADYRDREFQWHEEIERIVPGTLCEFRLCVMPQR